jgi:ABC-type glycerol-3-phosphate transport system permease component
MIGPLYWALSTSFKPGADVFASPPKWIPDPWTLANYKDVFTLLPFGRYFMNSIIVTGSITLNVGVARRPPFAAAVPRSRPVLPAPHPDGAVPGEPDLAFWIAVKLRASFGTRRRHLLARPPSTTGLWIFPMRQFIASVPDEILESAGGRGLGSASCAR